MTLSSVMILCRPAENETRRQYWKDLGIVQLLLHMEQDSHLLLHQAHAKTVIKVLGSLLLNASRCGCDFPCSEVFVEDFLGGDELRLLA